MNILQIHSSARREASHSTRLADRIVLRLRDTDPEARLAIRNLNRDPHPVLDEVALAALFTPAEQRTPAQAARVALDDALIDELKAADVVVLGVPMYNFGVPSQLKNWIDAISRAVGIDAEPELRRNHDMLAMRRQRLADELLVREWTISFSRVEHRHAAFDRSVDQSDGVLAVGGGTVGPRQSHAAVPDRRCV